MSRRRERQGGRHGIPLMHERHGNLVRANFLRERKPQEVGTGMADIGILAGSSQSASSLPNVTTCANRQKTRAHEGGTQPADQCTVDAVEAQGLLRDREQNCRGQPVFESLRDGDSLQCNE